MVSLRRYVCMAIASLPRDLAHVDQSQSVTDASTSSVVQVDVSWVDVVHVSLLVHHLASLFPLIPFPLVVHFALIDKNPIDNAEPFSLITILSVVTCVMKDIKRAKRLSLGD